MGIRLAVKLIINYGSVEEAAVAARLLIINFDYVVIRHTVDEWFIV